MGGDGEDSLDKVAGSDLTKRCQSHRPKGGKSHHLTETWERGPLPPLVLARSPTVLRGIGKTWQENTMHFNEFGCTPFFGDGGLTRLGTAPSGGRQTYEVTGTWHQTPGHKQDKQRALEQALLGLSPNHRKGLISLLPPAPGFTQVHPEPPEMGREWTGAQMATEPSRPLNAPWCWGAVRGGPLPAQMPEVVHLPGDRGRPQPPAFMGSSSVRGN